MHEEHLLPGLHLHFDLLPKKSLTHLEPEFEEPPVVVNLVGSFCHTFDPAFKHHARGHGPQEKEHTLPSYRLSMIITQEEQVKHAVADFALRTLLVGFAPLVGVVRKEALGSLNEKSRTH